MTRLDYTSEVTYSDRNEATVIVYVSETDEADGTCVLSLELPFTFRAETVGPDDVWDFVAELASGGEGRCTRHGEGGVDSSVDLGDLGDFLAMAMPGAMEHGEDAAWQAMHEVRDNWTGRGDGHE